MAEKSVKKTTTKKTTTAKKAVVKPVAAKKAAAKKAPVKKASVKKVTEVKNVTAPVAEKMACGCDKGCACAGNCADHAKCKCKKCGFFKKFIMVLIIFALGFAAAKMCCCKKGKFGPKPEFNNGCLVVKCPKMAELAHVWDVNHDGCVNKEEFKAGKKEMRRHKADMPKPVEEMPAPAPQMAE